MPTVDPVRVTLAERSDVAGMVAISNDAATRYVANFATRPEPLSDWEAMFDRAHLAYPWLVAKTGERVVGFARGLAHRERPVRPEVSKGFSRLRYALRTLS